jgi:prepilin-type N-terminal cleavage/methylation domain-containing protein
MKSASSITQPAARRRGFTLAELLAVLVIMGILIAAVIPSLSGLTRSAAVRGATLQVRAALIQARQFAITRRTTTSVLFPDQGNNTNTGNRAIAVYASASPNGYFISDWMFMPPGIVLATTNLGTVIWDPMIMQNGYQSETYYLFNGPAGAPQPYNGMQCVCYSSSGQIGSSPWGSVQTGQGGQALGTNAQVLIYEGGVNPALTYPSSVWGRPNGSTNQIQIVVLNGKLLFFRM